MFILQMPLNNPVQETDRDHSESEVAWNQARRTAFVNVRLRPHTVNWTCLGVHIRDPVLELSIRRLAQVDGSNPDIRARFIAVLSANDVAIRYRPAAHADAPNLSPRHLGVTARDNLLYDLAYLESMCIGYITVSH